MLKAIFIFFMCLSSPISKGNLYPLTMECISRVDDVAYCEDANGNVWSFECDDSCVGDLYSVIMNDNGTQRIEDDYIECIRFYK